jgi:methionine-rich copper-binding protein CopC
LVVALLALPAGVFAHAELRESEPPDGGTLAATPAQLTLKFSQNLVPSQSWVAIRDAQGGDVQLAVTVDPNDRKVMRATTPQLMPGVYTIRWQSLSADDDDFAQGSYKLTVLNPDGSKPAGEDDSTGTVLLIIGAGVLAAVTAFGVWFFLQRDKQT